MLARIWLVPLACLAACSFDAPATEPVAVDAVAPDDEPVADAPAVGDGPAPDAAACTSFTPAGDSAYLVGTTNVTWSAAEQLCQSEPGGRLVILETPAENTLVRGLVPTATRFWLGMSDLGTENTWRWLDGTAVPRDAAYWDATQPNDSAANGGEDCGEMSNSGTWNDDNCSALQVYVCECTP